MYIVAPIRELDVARNNASFNTAVMIGRDGTVLGRYRKKFPVIGNTTGGEGEEGVTPGLDGVFAWHLDFGTVAVLTCL